LHCLFASGPNCFHSFCSWLRACASSATHLSCVGLMPPSNLHSRAIYEVRRGVRDGHGVQGGENDNRQVGEHLVLRVRGLQSFLINWFQREIGNGLVGITAETHSRQRYDDVTSALHRPNRRGNKRAAIAVDAVRRRSVP
jgi:hypothetical protein